MNTRVAKLLIVLMSFIFTQSSLAVCPPIVLYPYTGLDASWTNLRLGDEYRTLYPGAKNNNISGKIYIGLHWSKFFDTELGYELTEAVNFEPGIGRLHVSIPYLVAHIIMPCWETFAPYYIIGAGRPKLHQDGLPSPSTSIGFRTGFGAQWPFCNKQFMLRAEFNYQQMDNEEQGAHWLTSIGIGLVLNLNGLVDKLYTC